mgnify:CR=1 FL=1
MPRLTFSSFASALEYLFEKACHESTVVVLDDYPNLRKHIENCDDVLQELIDRYRGTSQLKLVLCGSAIEEMRSLRDGGNPIGQRIDLTLHLKAMDYEQASAFYPNFSNEDKMRLYSVFGGVPFFLRLIDSRLTVRENILKLISSSNSFCAIALQLFLTSEFAKLESVNLILNALSKRPLKFSELLDETGIKSGAKMNYTLNKLCEMELIKTVSAESYSDNNRCTRYTIADNLVHYYFSFVDVNLNRIAIYGAEHTFDRFVADGFEMQFVPEVAKTIVV